MPSFDTVLEPNLVELRNAVDQSNKEIGTRFDFKGSAAGGSASKVLGGAEVSEESVDRRGIASRKRITTK